MEQKKCTTEETVYLTVKEVSEYLKIKIKTLYAMVSVCEIPHYRIGRLLRFTKQDIDAWIETKKVAPQPGKNRIEKSPRKCVADIKSILRKVIDAEKDKDYNRVGKSDHVKGLGKEVKDGAI